MCAVQKVESTQSVRERLAKRKSVFYDVIDAMTLACEEKVKFGIPPLL